MIQSISVFKQSREARITTDFPQYRPESVEIENFGHKPPVVLYFSPVASPFSREQAKRLNGGDDHDQASFNLFFYTGSY